VFRSVLVGLLGMMMLGMSLNVRYGIGAMIMMDV
jgi:hypothetical protein